MCTVGRGVVHVEDERLAAAPWTFLLQLCQQFGEANGCDAVGSDCVLILQWNRHVMAVHVKESTHHHLAHTPWPLVEEDLHLGEKPTKQILPKCAF